MKTIILCGGGTAGHVVPCLALIPSLKKHFQNIYYLGSDEGMEKDLVKEAGIPFYSINSIKFSRTNLFSNVKIPFYLPKCVNECKDLLKKLKPDVVFSKGGYISLPVTLASKKLNIPYVIHESDATLGLANKVVAKSAKYVLTNFNDTASYKNALSVGIPLRDSLYSPLTQSEALKKLNLSNRKTILVTGGSLGAVNINNAVENALPNLLDSYNVIHIVGKNNVIKPVKLYGYYPIPYTSEMGLFYKASDIVVSRAGATTISELIALSKKAVLIPLSKKASRGDQLKNVEKIGSYPQFRVIYDENLTSNLLTEKINELDKISIDHNPLEDSSTQKTIDYILSAMR